MFSAVRKHKHSSKGKSITSQIANIEVGNNSRTTLLLNPKNIIYFKPLYTSKLVPEVDYNNTLFYVDGEDYHRNVYIRDAIRFDLRNQLRDKLLRKSYDRESFQCDLMAMPDGVALPPHRPLIEDQQDLHLAFWAFLDWTSRKLRASGSTQLYPDILIPIVDPIPGIDIDNLPISSFPDFNRHLFMSSDADAVHVSSIDAFFHYVEINVTPRSFWRWPREYVDISLKGDTIGYGDYHPFFPRGTVVVIWNARSMARPSFEKGFKKLYEAHKPSLLVITQARITWQHCKQLVHRLPGNYKCSVFQNLRDCGGVVVIWKLCEIVVKFIEENLEPMTLFKLIAKVSSTSKCL